MKEEILTKEQIAEEFQVKPLTIMEWVNKKGMPCSDLESGLPRFLRSDCVDWKFKKGIYGDAEIKIPKEYERLEKVCSTFICSAERVDCVNCAFNNAKNFDKFIKQVGL